MYNITQMAADVIMIQAKMQQEYELYQSNIDIAEQEKMRLDKNVAKFLESYNGHNAVNNKKRYNKIFKSIFKEAKSCLKAIEALNNIKALNKELNKKGFIYNTTVDNDAI